MIRRALFVALAAGLLAWSAPAWAAISHVQSNITYAGVNTTVATTLGVNVTAGSCLAVAVGWDNAARSLSVADNINGAHTAVDGRTDAFGGGVFRMETWYFKNAGAGSTTVTATFSGSVNNMWIVAHELGGCDTSAPLDQHQINDQNAPGTGTDAITSGSVTTTTNGQYIFGATFDYTFSGDGYSAGTGYIPRQHTIDFASEDQVQGSAGAIAATFTTSFTPTRDLTAIMTFKAASSGGCIVGGGIIRAGCAG